MQHTPLHKDGDSAHNAWPSERWVRRAPRLGRSSQSTRGRGRCRVGEPVVTDIRVGWCFESVSGDVMHEACGFAAATPRSRDASLSQTSPALPHGAGSYPACPAVTGQHVQRSNSITYLKKQSKATPHTCHKEWILEMAVKTFLR